MCLFYSPVEVHCGRICYGDEIKMAASSVNKSAVSILTSLWPRLHQEKLVYPCISEWLFWFNWRRANDCLCSDTDLAKILGNLNRYVSKTGLFVERLTDRHWSITWATFTVTWCDQKNVLYTVMVVPIYTTSSGQITASQRKTVVFPSHQSDEICKYWGHPGYGIILKM